MLRLSACAALLFASLSVLVVPASAQLPSAATLTGNYNVRYLGVLTDPSDTPVSFSGTFTFDGKGGYTVTGSGTTASGALKNLSSGTYTVYSSGMVELSNPFDPVTSNSTLLFGGVGANGVVIASSTDTLYCDFFVAIPQATNATNATLTGNYNVMSLEFPGGAFTNTRDTFFGVSADGKGGLGNVTVQGTSVSLSGAATTQTSAAATYSLTTNGSGTLTLPAPNGVTPANALLSGAKVLAVSPDGNFFIAGSQTGFDFIVGLKTLPAGQTAALNGLYFSTYLEDYLPGSSDPSAGIYSGEGAANEIASLQNTEIIHQRTNPDGFTSYDQIYQDQFQFTSNGTVNYTGDSFYAMGPNGDMAIGAGQGNSNYLLVIYLKAPTMNGTGVFLNPQGVVNAASSAPFTAQYAPGEVVTLYGTGIATTDANLTGLPFPNTLGNVQVMVSGGSGTTAINAPLYSVCATCSPQQISAVIPYNVTSSNSLITFQVINNGTQSNTVTGYLGNSAPGVFTVPPGGIYPGAIQHAADFSLVSSSSPAKAGETVIIYLTGLGPVSPAVTAGSAAPSTNPAKVVNPVAVYIGGQQANVTFSGLTPTVGGLYQINCTIPSGLSAGNQVVEILTSIVVDSAGDLSVDVDAAEALIPIGQ